MKPQLKEKDVRKIVEANKANQSVMSMVGVRGYYLNVGKRDKNDRGVYDDAIFLVSPRGVIGYQANTDPSRYRKGIATLATGIHRYGTGTHKGRLAFRQAEKVTVYRDGEGKDCGFFGLNVHDGGVKNTSSLGCQTIPSGQWNQFRKLAYQLLEEYNQPKGKNDWGQPSWIFDYILINETDRRNGDLIVSNRYF